MGYITKKRNKMNSNVNTKELKEIIDIIIRYKSSGCNINLAIHGTHGIGKTDVVRQVAEDHGIYFCPLYLSNHDVGDLIGLPYKVKLDNGEEVTLFAKPNWLHEANKHERTVFFLDEINRAEKFVLDAMMPFLLNGKIHEHSIKPNDVVICALNPDTDDYSVRSFSDKALLSRFSHVYFEPTSYEWVNYLRDRGDIHPSLISAMCKSDDICNKNLISTEKIEVEPDRRSLTNLGIIMKAMSSSEINGIGRKLFSSMVGEEATNIILESYNEKVKINISSVINETIYDKIDITTDIEHVALINKQIIDHIIENNKVHPSFSKYLGKLGQDTVISFIKDFKKCAESAVDRELYSRFIFDTFYEIEKHLGYALHIKASKGIGIWDPK